MLLLLRALVLGSDHGTHLICFAKNATGSLGPDGARWSAVHCLLNMLLVQWSYNLGPCHFAF